MLITERRSIKRFELDLPSVLTDPRTGADHAIRTRDISANGAFLIGPPCFQPGTVVSLRIRLERREGNGSAAEPSPVINTRGRVVRSNLHGVGVEFSKPCRISRLVQGGCDAV
jgi:hypothetical protein